MLGYDFFYSENMKLFSNYKNEMESNAEAMDMSRRFIVSMINHILKRTHGSIKEKLTEIKALNDAYNDCFPPDEA